MYLFSIEIQADQRDYSTVASLCHRFFFNFNNPKYFIRLEKYILANLKFIIYNCRRMRVWNWYSLIIRNIWMHWNPYSSVSLVNTEELYSYITPKNKMQTNITIMHIVRLWLWRYFISNAELWIANVCRIDVCLNGYIAGNCLPCTTVMLCSVNR